MFDKDALETMTDKALLAALEELPESEHPPILEVQRHRAYEGDKYAEAASLALRISEIAKSDSDQELLATSLTNAGKAFYQNNEDEEAAKLFEEAAQIFKQIGNQRRAADLLYRKSDALYFAGKEELAITSATEAMEFATMEGEFALVGKSLFIRAQSQYDLSKTIEAIDDALEAIENLAIAGLSELVAEAYEFTGRCLYSLKRFEESISYLQKALIIYEISPTSDSKEKIPWIRQKIIFNLYSLSRFEEAISVAEVASKEFKELGEIEGIASCEFEIGDALQELGRNNEAIEHLLKAETLAESYGNKKQANDALHYRALAHHNEGRFQEALDLNKRLILTAKEQENLDCKEMAYVGFARMLNNLVGLEKYEEVVKLYEEPLPWLTFTPPEKDRLAAKSIYCRALFSLERKQEALQVANEGISEASLEHWAFVIATFFEVRGRLTEESHPRQSEQDLANSIALYLASGAVNRAEELSTKFMPEFSENKDVKSL